MTVPLTTSLREGTEPPVLAVAGEIDMATAPRLRSALAAAAAQHDRFTLDLTDVTYLDSAGIRVLYDHTPHLAGLIVPPDSVITRALTIAGLHTLLTDGG
jgi:anti-sigma B factor antagonist